MGNKYGNIFAKIKTTKKESLPIGIRRCRLKCPCRLVVCENIIAWNVIKYLISFNKLICVIKFIDSLTLQTF